MSYFWDGQGWLSGDFDGRAGDTADPGLPPVPEDLKCAHSSSGSQAVPVPGAVAWASSRLHRLLWLRLRPHISQCMQGQVHRGGVDQHEALGQHVRRG